ncbi:tubulin-tyrosine ligase family protein (macronuclear) [Tetrahymena thermophila SB210]|uniref:Tubulin-tyrosine ligase family protein n=1 Tax=Tetrahymena thermophila (strain SB210) TaxID=312017 RepID=Q22P59_TETTS|nr:tubulin-tyrosine ligase family protein [Tetrahymena thermophila SB210]EAR86952.4 tubulin-tyrosine ligase family protein [Tetrahymena thermophila SB210]|eukprot:XP_001007197.4 tubulin-tyrosine ligase family protein [Tetrahymena thermophila SB210]
MNHYQIKALDLSNLAKNKEGSQNQIDTSTVDSDGYREIKIHNNNKIDYTDINSQQSIILESQGKSGLLQSNFQLSSQKMQNNNKQQDQQKFIINVYEDSQINQYAQDKSMLADPKAGQSTNKAIIENKQNEEADENQFFNINEFMKECQGSDNQQRVLFKGSTKQLLNKIETYQNLQLFLNDINDPYENEQARQRIFNIILRELINLLYVILQSNVNPYPYLLDCQQDFEKNVLILLGNIDFLKRAKTADGFKKSALFEFLLTQYKLIKNLQVQTYNERQKAKQLSSQNFQNKQEIQLKSDCLYKIQENQEFQESQLSNKILLESPKSPKSPIRKISYEVSNSPKLRSIQSGSKSPQSKQNMQLITDSPNNGKFVRQQSFSPKTKSAKGSPVKTNQANSKCLMMQSQQLPSKSTLKYNNYKVDKILRICVQEDDNLVARNNRDFYNVLNYSNAISVHDLDKKFFNKNRFHFAVVDDGSDLGEFIKDSLDRRPWWNTQHYNQKYLESANFVWTQFKSQNYCQKLLTKQVIQNQYYIKNNFSLNKQGEASNTQTPRQIQFAVDAKQETTYQTGLKLLVNQVDYQYITSFTPNKKDQIIPPFITVSAYMEEVNNKSQQFLSNKYLWEINNLKEIKIHNHFQYGYYLNMNQGLYFQLSSYYEYLNIDKNNILIPETFLIESKYDSESIRLNKYISNIQKEIEAFEKLSFDQQQLQKIKQRDQNFIQIDLNSLFIVKTIDTYQQTQISKSLLKLSQVEEMISKQLQLQPNGITYIVQKYINNPLLLQDKKFRIKYQLLLTNYNGILKVYFYNAGYGQVARKPYKGFNDMEAHFVGYKQQQFNQDRNSILETFYEENQIINIEDLEKLINKWAKKINPYYSFQDQAIPQIKQILIDVVKSTYQSINPTNKQFRFQIIELDLLLDENFKIWLIDSTNDIKVTDNSQRSYYSQLIENVFQITIDPIFQPLENVKVDQSRRYYKEDYFLTNQFKLIFDSQIDSFKFQHKEQSSILKKLQSAFQENIQANKQSPLKKQYQNIIKQI